VTCTVRRSTIATVCYVHEHVQHQATLQSRVLPETLEVAQLLNEIPHLTEPEFNFSIHNIPPFVSILSNKYKSKPSQYISFRPILISFSHVKLLAPSGLSFVVYQLNFKHFSFRPCVLMLRVMLRGYKSSSIHVSNILGVFSYPLQLKTGTESIFKNLWTYLKMRTLDKIRLNTSKGFGISSSAYQCKGSYCPVSQKWL
jgi:hypothetical protein